MFLAATALDVQLEFQIKPSSMQCHPRTHIPGFLLRAARQCDDRISSAVGYVLLEPSPSSVCGDMPKQLRSVRLAHFHCNRFWLFLGARASASDNTLERSTFTSCPSPHPHGCVELSRQQCKHSCREQQYSSAGSQ